MLEAGWRADTAIQWLGRSQSHNQAAPPLFRPVAPTTAEKALFATIARRLDTLGATTKDRPDGGQGRSRRGHLESVYAKAALRQFYRHLSAGQDHGLPLLEFEEMTGTVLRDRDGAIKDECRRSQLS